MNPKNSILSVKNLSISFSDFEALNSVSFNIKKGECTALVGESGSGKSLSSMAIMGLLPKTAEIKSGEIIFQQENKPTNLLTLDNKAHRKLRGKVISMIFQEPMTSLNPTLTCGYQVAEILRQHTNFNAKVIQSKVLDLFKEVMLPRPDSIFKSYPHQISGGQKQRVMIAMAIACKPELLIADEPTTALDVTVQKEILQLIAKLQRKYKMSVLFITHDLGVVKSIAKDVIVMQKGKIVESGETEEVFKNAKHPYTKGLLASRPPINKRPKTLQTVQSFLNNSSENTILISKEERKLSHQKIYSEKPILKVKNLKTQFSIQKNWLGKTTKFLDAVNLVSFELYKGETLGLVGESGCGKTTLGRSLIKLETASEGEVLYHDKNILNFNKKEMSIFRKQFQIIFQDPYSSLNPKLTVGAIISEVLKVHKIAKTSQEIHQRTYELLEKVGLEPKHFNHYPHELSGGQRQRVGIARALAVEPEIIICDESVSALDVSVQAQVLNLLNHLKQEFNLTYIFISHDLSVVRYMSDRVIVMNQGSIEEEGEADTLFQHPKNSYTQKLIHSIP